MLTLFDYIFYRAYKLGVGRSKAPLAYAAGIIAASQFFAMLTLYAFANYFLVLPEINILGFAVIAFSLLAVNWYMYERNPRLDEMDERWGSEGGNKKLIKGWLIVFSIAFLVITPLVIAKKDYESKHPRVPRVHRIK